MTLLLKYVTTNANYCKTIPKKNNFYSALCSQISQTYFHCSWFMMHVWEAISKTRGSCFIGVSKHSKTIKALGLRPRAFSFLVFGNPDETLALVFEILHLAWNRAWRIIALGVDSTDLAALGPYCQNLGPIFSQYGPRASFNKIYVLLVGLVYNCSLFSHVEWLDDCKYRFLYKRRKDS